MRIQGLKPWNFCVTLSLSLDKNNTIERKQNNCHICVWFLHNNTHSVLQCYQNNGCALAIPGQEAPAVLLLFLDD